MINAKTDAITRNKFEWVYGASIKIKNGAACATYLELNWWVIFAEEIRIAKQAPTRKR